MEGVIQGEGFNIMEVIGEGVQGFSKEEGRFDGGGRV